MAHLLNGLSVIIDSLGNEVFTFSCLIKTKYQDACYVLMSYLVFIVLPVEVTLDYMVFSSIKPRAVIHI